MLANKLINNEKNFLHCSWRGELVTLCGEELSPEEYEEDNPGKIDCTNCLTVLNKEFPHWKTKYPQLV